MQMKHWSNSFVSVGEAAGKAPLGVAKREDVNVNINQLRGKTDSANSVINDTKMVWENSC